MTVDAVGTARRGRGARKAQRQTRDVTMLPALRRRLPLTEPMDGEQIERIDAASMAILEEVGVSSSATPSRWPTGKGPGRRWRATGSTWTVAWCAT